MNQPIYNPKLGGLPRPTTTNPSGLSPAASILQQARLQPNPATPKAPSQSAATANLPAQAPPVPTTIEATGLQQDLLIQLLVKMLFTAGETTEASAADRLKLPYPVVEELFRTIRTDKLCEIKGTNGLLYRYLLTDVGRARAREYMDISQYVGPAPVPLKQYTAMMLRQSVLHLRIDRQTLERSTKDMILTPQFVNTLGVAVNSGFPIFLYGPPGNGKTLVAETIGNMLGNLGGGEIFIPHAIEIDNQIIQLYDAAIHKAVELPAEESPSGAESNSPYDQRWVLIKRPLVIVGGELALEMLDLSFNPISKFYEAPPQVRATGGVFLIDDFGRQRVQPQDLLNRWIVPLEKRVDYLTLHTGKKFQVPFDTIVVFSTNLDPFQLADEAFLRRIRNKIFIGNPSLEAFTTIFRRVCEKRGIPYDPKAMDYLQKEYYEKYDLERHHCQPRDILDQVVSIAKFLGVPPTLGRELLDSACQTYFLLERQGDGDPMSGGFRK